MKYVITLLSLLISTFCIAQKKGLNFDPGSEAIGDRPYEMETRHEKKNPFVSFDNCEKWIIETENCNADLYLSSEQRIYSSKTGKLVYRTTNKEASIKLIYEKPIEIPEPWDCIDFWTFGDHWLWGEPHFSTAFRHFALIEGADGKTHEIDFSQSGYGGLVHKYWFLNHIKVNEKIISPAKFIGIKFYSNNTTPKEEHKLFLGPLYIYNESLRELSFKAFPKKLPFPLRKETILPINKDSTFRNSIKKNGSIYQLVYQGVDMTMKYNIDPSSGVLNGIGLQVNDNNYELCKDAEFIFTTNNKVSWKTKSEAIRHDTLFVEFISNIDKLEYNFSCWYTIKQKSLIVGIHENSEIGHVKEITLGKTGKLDKIKLVTVPFLPYNYSRHPKLLYGDNLFFFKQFDWYYSDASNLTTDNNVNDGWINYNNGVEYIPKTNGERNPVREKLFINVSNDVTEVLPTIDNPPSPMKSFQANRLWMIEGGDNYELNKKNARRLRSLGMENVTIRYHEGFWRDAGESYTFRTNTAPGRGGNKAVKEFIKDIKELDWRVGLYTNYTDFAPVNENWNPDWVLRERDGSWQISWSRCYAPKPMIALEQQALLAPIINKTLSPNHSYCDVHTAVSPMSRVDYDYRVPGAGTFRRTFECFGLLLLNEKKAYRGPVFSEGGNHWWYAGLVDGNYANYSPLINTIPIFPEFQLLKIHPLQMDAGNLPAQGNEYLAYTLAYGHIGILSGDLTEMLKRYAVLQTLQEHYVMVPIKRISYFDNMNNEFNSSDAIRRGLNERAKLKLEYDNGFTVYINFSDEKWDVYAMKKGYSLPKHGILAYTADWKTYALSGMCNEFKSNNNNYKIDLVVSQNQYYFDTHNSLIQIPLGFEAEGKIFLKNEKFGWEIIPADDFTQFSFNRDILSLENNDIIIEGVDSEDLLIEDAQTIHKGKLINMKHANKSIFKYRIIPTVYFP